MHLDHAVIIALILIEIVKSWRKRYMYVYSLGDISK